MGFRSPTRRQGYSIPLLFEDARLVQKVICEIVQKHILQLELSQLVSGLGRVMETLQLELRESSEAFMATEPEDVEAKRLQRHSWPIDAGAVGFADFDTSLSTQEPHRSDKASAKMRQSRLGNHQAR